MCQMYNGLLGGACDIHLECHQFHMPFPLSWNLLISESHVALFFHGVAVYSFKQSLNSSLQLPFKVFITQIATCELNIQSLIMSAYSNGRYLKPKIPSVLKPPIKEKFQVVQHQTTHHFLENGFISSIHDHKPANRRIHILVIKLCCSILIY
jgi:hypothetical protein